MTPPKNHLAETRPGGFEILPAHADAATEVHPGIYLSPGLSNAYLVVTPAGRVVINTGMGFEAPVHRRNFDAVSSAPIRYILLTQGHTDHVGGVDLFREAQTEIVAQARNRACQADDARIHRFRVRRSAVFWREAIRKATAHAQSPGGASGPSAQSRPEPTRVFGDHWDFELGGRRFELLATPGGETLDSMAIWLPDSRVAFVGNQFSALFPHFPNLVTLRADRPRSALRYLESLERIRALEPELLLTGHFGPIRGQATIRRALDDLEAAVRHVHDETVDGMNAGRSLPELMREIRLPDSLDVGEGYGRVSWSVRTIWEEYAGWFQHESTTELYGVPPRDAYPELAQLAGGAGPLSRRAGELLGAGEPEKALHLVEVALSNEPTAVDALRMQLAILEHLRERGQKKNFWEHGWLQNEIYRTRKALEGTTPT